MKIKKTFRYIVYLRIIPIIFLFFLPCISLGQTDLSKLLADDSTSGHQKVTAIFKTTRIIDCQSLETVKKKNLDFRITHRFGNVAGTSGGGSHQLYGFDNSADIRVAFEYGITDRLTAGFSRSKKNENLEGLLKFRLLEQTTDNHIPLAIVLFTNAALTTAANTTGDFDKFSHRLSYTFQGIIGRKFSSKLSLEVLPSMVHRNFVSNYYTDASSNFIYDKNDFFSIGIGGRIRISKHSALISDYFYNLSSFQQHYKNAGGEKAFFNSLAVGYEIETGGHVFSIMFSNSAGIIENEFIPNTTDSWLKGGFKFSFNISRTFKM